MLYPRTCEVTWSIIAVIIWDQITHHFFGLLKFKNAIFKILCSTAQHAGIAVYNHPPGGRHISTEIWQRLSSLFPFSRAFSAFPFFPPFPLFRGFLKNKSLCGGERSLYMFLFWYMQKCEPSSSRAYCILTQLTNSNVLGKLAMRDLIIWVIQEFLLVDLAKTQYTRDDEGPYSRINLDQDR